MVKLNAPFKEQDLDDIVFQAKKLGLDKVEKKDFVDILGPLCLDPENNDYYDVNIVFRMLDLDNSKTVDANELGEALSYLHEKKVGPD